jgi:hypothetical protein
MSLRTSRRGGRRLAGHVGGRARGPRARAGIAHEQHGDVLATTVTAHPAA